MRTQTYANHAHQPWPTLVAAGCWALALAGFVAALRGISGGVLIAGAGVLGALLCLISISRVYTTALQDRIILLEERLRAERLLTPTQRAMWEDLGIKQVVALRFAGDAEFAALTERASRESLPPKAIKQAVHTWRPDTRRT